MLRQPLEEEHDERIICTLDPKLHLDQAGLLGLCKLLDDSFKLTSMEPFRIPFLVLTTHCQVLDRLLSSIYLVSRTGLRGKGS